MQNGWDLAGEPGVPRRSDLKGARPTTVSCCSQEREMGERSSVSPTPGPGPYLHRHLDGTWPHPGQWGQHEPGGCGQCGQQLSRVGPGRCPWKCRSGPTPTVKEGCDGVLWRLGCLCVHGPTAVERLQRHPRVCGQRRMRPGAETGGAVTLGPGMPTSGPVGPV